MCKNAISSARSWQLYFIETQPSKIVFLAKIYLKYFYSDADKILVFFILVKRKKVKDKMVLCPIHESKISQFRSNAIHLWHCHTNSWNGYWVCLSLDIRVNRLSRLVILWYEKVIPKYYLNKCRRSMTILSACYKVGIKSEAKGNSRLYLILFKY